MLAMQCSKFYHVKCMHDDAIESSIYVACSFGPSVVRSSRLFDKLLLRKCKLPDIDRLTALS